MKINMKKYAVKPHPYKAILKGHGITTGVVANYLDRSYPYVSNMLNGQYRMPESIEKKLKLLVDQLEREQQTTA
jgi:hypothetical protein